MAANETANANVVLTADVSGYTQGVDQAQSSTQKLIGGVNSLTTSLSNMRKAAAQKLAIFAAADIAGLTAGVAVAAKFEQQLKTLSGVTAAASKNQLQFNSSMSVYREGINKIARDSSTSRSEIAALVTSLTQMGVKGPGEVTKVASTMNKLSKATGESATSMASSLTQFAQQMGTLGNGAASLDKYADSLVKVSSQAGVAASSVASFAQAIAPVARAAGVTATEVIGFSAAFAKAGADGFAAANTFNSILSEITRGVQTGSPDMAKYANLIGVTAQQFERMNKSQAIIQIFDAINSAGPKSLQILDQLGIDGVRAQRAIQAVAASGNLNQMITDATGDNAGLTSKAAAASENNLGSSLDRVKNQFEEIGSTIGEVWVGPLTRVVQLFGDMLSKVQPILDPIIKIGSIVAGIVAPIAAVVSALLSLAPIITPLALALTGISGFRAITSGFQARTGPVDTNNKFTERYTAGKMGPLQSRLYEAGMGAGSVASRLPWMQGAQPGTGVVQNFMRGAAAYGFQGAGAYFKMTGDLYDRARVDGTDHQKAASTHLSNIGSSLKGMFTSTDGFKKGLDTATGKLAAGIGPAPALGASMTGAIKEFGKMSVAAAKMSTAVVGSAAGAVASQAGMGAMKLGSGLMGAMGGPLGLAMMGGMAAFAINQQSNKNSENIDKVASESFNVYGEYTKSLDLATVELTGFAAAVKQASSSISADQATGNATEAQILAANAPNREITSEYVKNGNVDTVKSWLRSINPNTDPRVLDAIKLDIIQKFGVEQANSIMADYRSSYGIGRSTEGYTIAGESKSKRLGDITASTQEDFYNQGKYAGTQAQAAVDWTFGLTGGSGSGAVVNEDAASSITRAFASLKTGIDAIQSFGGTEETKKLTQDFFAAGLRSIAVGEFAGAREAQGKQNWVRFGDINPMDAGQTLVQTLRSVAEKSGYTNLEADASSFSSGAFDTTGANAKYKTKFDGVSDEDFAKFTLTQLYSQGGEGWKKFIDDQAGSLENLLTANYDPSQMVKGKANPVISALTASSLGDFAVNSSVIGNAMLRVNDPKANAAAVSALVDKADDLGGNLETAVDSLQQFKNAIGDTSNRLFQLADAAQKQYLFYRDANRPFLSYTEKVESTDNAYRDLQKALSIAEGNQAIYAKAVEAFDATPTRNTLNDLIRNNKYAGSTGQVSDTVDRMNQMTTNEITSSVTDMMSMVNSIGVGSRNFGIQKEQQTEDYNRQVKQNQFIFNLSMERQEDNFRRSELRSIDSFNRQRRYARDDFNRQERQSVGDHRRDIRNMVSQQMQTIYNPYQAAAATGGTSKSMLFANLREQTRLLKDQRKNLNLFKKLFPSEAAARNAIDMLDLTNPANAGQLEELVRTMSTQDAASLSQIYGQRRKATSDLVADEDNFGFRTQERAFDRSLKRQNDAFERQMKRQNKEFNISLGQSRADFERNVEQATKDFKRNARLAEESFTRSMTRAQEAYNLSIQDMFNGASNLEGGLQAIIDTLGSDSTGVIGSFKTLITLAREAGIKIPFLDVFETALNGAQTELSKTRTSVDGMVTTLNGLDGNVYSLTVKTDPETDAAATRIGKIRQDVLSLANKTYTFTLKGQVDSSGNATGTGTVDVGKVHGGAGTFRVEGSNNTFQIIQIASLGLGKRWGGKVGHMYDTVPVMAQKGEWFHRAEAANYYGDDVMSGINDMRINRSALKQAMQGNYASAVAYKGTDSGSVTNINASTNFNGQITVQAQDPNEMARKLAHKQRMAALTGRK